MEAQNLRHFVQIMRQGEALFDNGEQQVSAQSSPDLYAYSVFGYAEKCLYPQVLLYSFEEELHLPALLV